MKEERLVLFTCEDYQKMPIIKHQRINAYKLYPLKDQWVFPFIWNKIRLNLESLYMDDGLMGIVTSGELFKVKEQILLENDGNKLKYVYIKSNLIIPYKISSDNHVALISFVNALECIPVEQVNIHSKKTTDDGGSMYIDFNEFEYNKDLENSERYDYSIQQKYVRRGINRKGK